MTRGHVDPTDVLSSCDDRTDRALHPVIPASGELAPSPTLRSDPGMALNLITDVAGLTIGQAHDPVLASGVTVALFERPAVASVFVGGGAPAGRDQECLEPDRSVERVDAIVLSGGSGFGLDAASGVQAWLRARGRGLAVRDARVPIVPSAILFDLLNGGDKRWGLYPPYRELAYAACEAAGPTVALGSVGAGYGATTVDLKGGIGSASVATTIDGTIGPTVGAIAAVNSLGSATIGATRHFWAAPFEREAEFGGLGWPATIPPEVDQIAWKGGAQPGVPGAEPGTTGSEPGTTIAIVATDATLTKAQAKRLAIMAQAGLARALRLAFAPSDGDTVFAVATCVSGLEVDAQVLTGLGARAADCLARAVARGVHAATALPLPGTLPSWRDRE